MSTQKERGCGCNHFNNYTTCNHGLMYRVIFLTLFDTKRHIIERDKESTSQAQKISKSVLYCQEKRFQMTCSWGSANLWHHLPRLRCRNLDLCQEWKRSLILREYPSLLKVHVLHTQPCRVCILFCWISLREIPFSKNKDQRQSSCEFG